MRIIEHMGGLRMQKLFYSADECASIFRVSRSHVYRMINEGKIKSIEIGARKVIPASSLEELLKGTMSLSDLRQRK